MSIEDFHEKYICENKQKCAQSKFCVFVLFVYKSKKKKREEKMFKNTNAFDDMAVVGNLHVPHAYPSVPFILTRLCTFPYIPYTLYSFFFIFITIICLFDESNGKWCRLLLFCHWQS